MYLKEQRSHKTLHLKFEALAVANVKLLSMKDCGLSVFISVCFEFDLVLVDDECFSPFKDLLKAHRRINEKMKRKLIIYFIENRKI